MCNILYAKKNVHAISTMIGNAVSVQYYRRCTKRVAYRASHAMYLYMTYQKASFTCALRLWNFFISAAYHVRTLCTVSSETLCKNGSTNATFHSLYNCAEIGERTSRQTSVLRSRTVLLSWTLEEQRCTAGATSLILGSDRVISTSRWTRFSYVVRSIIRGSSDRPTIINPLYP